MRGKTADILAFEKSGGGGGAGQEGAAYAGGKRGKKERLTKIKTRSVPGMVAQYFLILQRQFTQLNVMSIIYLLGFSCGFCYMLN